MEIAVSGTELTSNHSARELVRLAGSARSSYVELWLPKNFECDGEEATLRYLERCGIKVAAISSGTEMIRGGRSPLGDQKLLAKAIRLASDVGAPIANTYFGHTLVRDDARAIACYLRRITPCLRLAEKLGVTIVIENEFNAFGWDQAATDITRRPAAFALLLRKAANKHLRTNFDGANYHCANVDAFPAAWAVLREFVAYVHVKDCLPAEDVVTPHLPPGSTMFTDYDRTYATVPLGWGEVKWREIVRALRMQGYSGFLTLEPHLGGSALSPELRRASGLIRRWWKDAG